MKQTLVFLLSISLCFCGCHGHRTVGEQQMLLRGTWVLDSSRIGRAYIPSFCHDLLPGSRFVFKEDSTFDVFAKDSASKCNYMTLDYHLSEDVLNFNEDDMMLHMDIVTLTADKLVLRSTYFDQELFNYKSSHDDSLLALISKGYEMYFRRVR